MLNIQLLLSNWKFIAAAVAVVVALAWFGARKCSQRSALAPAATPPEAVTVPSGSDYKSAIERAERAERARRRREEKR